jgi:hypothetical protein
VIPGWKIRRELARLGQQLRAIPEAVTDPLRQRHHDRRVVPNLGFIEGAQGLGPKVAIHLLYQPRGLAPSTVFTCAFLAAKGYAVLAVSNAAISADDRARLAPHVWRIVERPNFGYDFGGYRDGIRLLRRWGVVPGTLLILNDSVWFPLDPATRAVEDLEAHPADLAGAILRERGAERFLESYLYRIGGRLWDDPAFWRYWDGLALTSNKYHVIRRGERGFSRAVLEAGATLGAVWPTADFADRLAREDDDFLRLTLRHAAYVDADLTAERDALLRGGGAGWRDRVTDHVRRTLVKRQAYSSFPVAMARLTGHTVLKKSREPVSAAWRRAYAEAVHLGALPAPVGPVAKEVLGTGNGDPDRT